MSSHQGRKWFKAREPYIQIIRPPSVIPVEITVGSMAYGHWAIGSSEYLVDIGIRTHDMIMLNDERGNTVKHSYVGKSYVHVYDGDVIRVKDVFGLTYRYTFNTRGVDFEEYWKAWNSFWLSQNLSEMMYAVMMLGYGCDKMLYLMIEIFEACLDLSHVSNAKKKMAKEIISVVIALPPQSVRREVGKLIRENVTLGLETNASAGVLAHAIMPIVEMKRHDRVWSDENQIRFLPIRLAKAAYYFTSQISSFLELKRDAVDDVAVKLVRKRIPLDIVFSLIHNNGKTAAGFIKVYGGL